MRRLTFREREGVSIGPAGEISELEAEGIAKLAERLPAGALAWGHRHAEVWAVLRGPANRAAGDRGASQNRPWR
jgi:hypothetical protein